MAPSSRGLGHMIFIHGTRVRIPAALLKIKFVKLNRRLTIRHYFYAAFLLLLMAGKNKVVVWASSLVGKAPHLHCGDHGFDSHLCPVTFMPWYPIVGMDGTENPRNPVRLRNLALFSDLIAKAGSPAVVEPP